MIDEVTGVAVESSVHGVGVLVAHVEVQVKEVGSSLGVILLTSLLGFFAEKGG